MSSREFPSESNLRDIAKTAAADDGIYGYGDVGSNGQSNHALSHTFEDADEIDPAALLENLANFEHPSSGNEASSNDHFASLLQAATTATEAEAAQIGNGHMRRVGSDQFGFLPPSPNSNHKRKRQDGDGSLFSKSKRSRRGDPSEEEEEQLAREREIWGPEEEDDGDEDDSAFHEYEKTPEAKANARSVGVHSAAALFRRPSSASKKYTRPPMSKLFTSLELTPEQFLHLQAAAKNYMLDKKHPERIDCVGNRGKGDTDMTKLKLYSCVNNFLQDEGWGERLFGQNAPEVHPRKLKWPLMKNKLISAITPLLRRMVTNERQRQYALEYRKGKGKSKKGKKRHSEQDPELSMDDNAAEPTQCDGLSRSRRGSRTNVISSPSPEIDPDLNQYHYVVQEQLPAEDGHLSQSNNDYPILFPTRSPDADQIKYIINIIKDGERIKPRFVLAPSTCPGFPSLVQHIQSIMDDGRGTRSIQILGPNGLIEVTDQSSWVATIESIKQIEWMDGEVKVVVLMEET